MARQGRALGMAIFITCIGGFIIYAWFLLVSEWKEIVLQLTVLAAVAGLLGVLAWIGLAMATRVKQTDNIDKIQSDSERSKV
jgi:predicted DNA-binding transcriptional regulator